MVIDIVQNKYLDIGNSHHGYYYLSSHSSGYYSLGNFVDSYGYGLLYVYYGGKLLSIDYYDMFDMLSGFSTDFDSSSNDKLISYWL